MRPSAGTHPGSALPACAELEFLFTLIRLPILQGDGHRDRLCSTSAAEYMTDKETGDMKFLMAATARTAESISAATAN